MVLTHRKTNMVCMCGLQMIGWSEVININPLNYFTSACIILHHYKWRRVALLLLFVPCHFSSNLTIYWTFCTLIFHFSLKPSLDLCLYVIVLLFFLLFLVLIFIVVTLASLLSDSHHIKYQLNILSTGFAGTQSEFLNFYRGAQPHHGRLKPNCQ